MRQKNPLHKNDETWQFGSSGSLEWHDTGKYCTFAAEDMYYRPSYIIEPTSDWRYENILFEMNYCGEVKVFQEEAYGDTQHIKIENIFI